MSFVIGEIASRPPKNGVGWGEIRRKQQLTESLSGFRGQREGNSAADQTVVGQPKGSRQRRRSRSSGALRAAAAGRGGSAEPGMCCCLRIRGRGAEGPRGAAPHLPTGLPVVDPGASPSSGGAGFLPDPLPFLPFLPLPAFFFSAIPAPAGTALPAAAAIPAVTPSASTAAAVGSRSARGSSIALACRWDLQPRVPWKF